MRLGVVYPQTEIGNDPAVVRDYAQAAEGLGYRHVLAFDHVLGGNAATHTLRGPYRHTDAFHEPFVLFGFLAAAARGRGSPCRGPRIRRDSSRRRRPA